MKKRGQVEQRPEPSFKPIFGEYQRCTACGGKMHQKGHTDRPCTRCLATPGYEKIVPLRRPPPSEDVQ